MSHLIWEIRWLKYLSKDRRTKKRNKVYAGLAMYSRAHQKRQKRQKLQKWQNAVVSYNALVSRARYLYFQFFHSYTPCVVASTCIYCMSSSFCAIFYIRFYKITHSLNMNQSKSTLRKQFCQINKNIWLLFS